MKKHGMVMRRLMLVLLSFSTLSVWAQLGQFPHGHPQAREASDIEVVDWDGDGQSDLVFFYEDTGEVYIKIGDDWHLVDQHPDLIGIGIGEFDGDPDEEELRGFFFEPPGEAGETGRFYEREIGKVGSGLPDPQIACAVAEPTQSHLQFRYYFKVLCQRPIPFYQDNGLQVHVTAWCFIGGDQDERRQWYTSSALDLVISNNTAQSYDDFVCDPGTRICTHRIPKAPYCTGLSTWKACIGPGEEHCSLGRLNHIYNEAAFQNLML